MTKKDSKLNKPTKYKTISDKEFFKTLEEVNRKYGKALKQLAKM